ncbi:MAG: WecB/TagA/CpsF family glycosyltransferase [Pseudomonadota bacterium]
MNGRCESVLGTRIHALSWDETIGRIAGWGAARESRSVCLGNVHVIVTATREAAMRRALDAADIVLPDGAPVAWTLRRFGHVDQERINGPDLMWRYLAEAERSGQIVFFYGSTQRTLDRLRQALARSFPRLRIAGMVSPPFQPQSSADVSADVRAINACGTQILFVGLGCPKQEKWMAAQRGHVHAVMIGVGAAFDYHAGTLRRAPVWMQHQGLEWCFRLYKEPRRLFMRYLVTNTLFILRLSAQFAGRLRQRPR